MLLGLATILAGSLARNDPAVSEPTFVGLILLFLFFTLAHINHEIESGQIARGQAKLRSYNELYEKTINGTFLLSSPGQHEIFKLHHGNGGFVMRGRVGLDHRYIKGLAQGVGRSVGR
jgi:hypothetical protein